MPRYSVTVFKQRLSLWILLVGFVLSFLLSFGIVILFPVPKTLFVLIVLAGFTASYLIMSRFSKRQDYVEVFDTKIVSDYYGIIDFVDITTYNYNDLADKSILQLKLKTGKTIAFIDDNKGDFTGFYRSYKNAVVQSNIDSESKIREKDFFKSKYSKPFGIFSLIILLIFLIWAFFYTEITLWKVFRVIISLMILSPFYIRLFRHK